MENRTEVFWELFREQPPAYIEELEQWAKENDVPIIRRATRDLLRYLLRTRSPRHVLEVGTAIGYSALFMKENMPENSDITTVEKVPARIREARENFRKYDGRGQIFLREGDAAQVLKELVIEKREKSREGFDFVFMDAAKGQYLTFLPDVLELMEPGGILVSDNILHGGDVLESRYAVTRRDRTIHGRMREYLKVLTEHEDLETICLSLGDGVTLSAYLPRGTERRRV